MGAHCTLDDTRKALMAYICGDSTFAIVYQEHGKVIGSLGIGNVTPTGGVYANLAQRGMGYALSRHYWSHSLVPEAVVKWVFENTDTGMLLCGCLADNVKSRRVIEKCGFSFVCGETFHKEGKTVYGGSCAAFRTK